MSSMYCEQWQVEFIMTKFGLQAFLSERDPSAPVVPVRVTSLIVLASLDIDYYCRQRYATTQLNGNDWVSWSTAIISSMKAVRRKQGAHSGLQAEFDDVIAKLKEIRAFTAEIPSAYPISEPGLWHSNVQVDQAFVNRKVRVNVTTSSNEQSSVKVRSFSRWDIVLEP